MGWILLIVLVTAGPMRLMGAPWWACYATAVLALFTFGIGGGIGQDLDRVGYMLSEEGKAERKRARARAQRRGDGH